MPSKQESGCVIVPAFNEEKFIKQLVIGIRQYIPNVLVIDDGSIDSTAEEARKGGAYVIRHTANLGKGRALISGFKHAINVGYDFVVTMDGDGQHLPEDLPLFINEYFRSKSPVIIGNRMNNPENMPLVRKITNRFMSWCISKLIHQHVPDTQNGFRLYSSSVLPLLIDVQSEGFAAESEVLLYLSAKKIKITYVPISVIYGNEKSKIRPIRDTWRFFKMLFCFFMKSKLKFKCIYLVIFICSKVLYQSIGRLIML